MMQPRGSGPPPPPPHGLPTTPGGSFCGSPPPLPSSFSANRAPAASVVGRSANNSMSAPNRPPPPPPPAGSPAHNASLAAAQNVPASSPTGGDRPFIPARPSIALGQGGIGQFSAAGAAGAATSRPGGPPPPPGALSVLSSPTSNSLATSTSNASIGRPAAAAAAAAGASSPSSAPAPMEITPIPEDNPNFWREVHALRTNTKQFADGLDEFMSRVFFPRKKRVEVKEKSSIFSFAKPSGSPAASGASNPLLANLISPSAANSSIAHSSLSSSGVSHAAAVDRVNAAQQGFDLQKNKAFLASYASRQPPAGEGKQNVTELASLITNLSIAKAQLDERLDSFERFPMQFHDALAAIQHKLSEHDETKKQVHTKLQKYLSHKVGTNVEKALEQEKKIRTRRLLMNSLRFDASCELKRITENEELSVLKPMSSLLATYWEFYESGYKLLQPLHASGALTSLSSYVSRLEEAAERQSTAFAQSKRVHEAGATALASLTSANATALNQSLTGLGGTASTGIRDLDAFAKSSTVQTKACEKEGYLYLPAPNFTPVYATIGKGKIVLNREALNQADLTVDLLICTVKENRDAKLRWCFNIISPSEKEPLLLQADSAEGFQEWMTVIQNAISQQLNAGGSAADSSTPASASTHHSASSGSHASSKSGHHLHSSSSSTAAAGSNGSSQHHHGHHHHHHHHGNLPGFGSNGGGPNGNSHGHLSGSPSSSPSSSSSASSAPTSNSSNPHAVGSGSMFGSAKDGFTSSAVLTQLRQVPGNDQCADCSQKDPDWVSLNLGIVICMECSGVHRALGVHISKVRSTTLDKLDGYMVSYLSAVGNNLARSVWEASLLLTEGGADQRVFRTQQGREFFIRQKYEMRSFLGPTREKDKAALNAKMFHAIENGLLPQLIESLAWGANPQWANPDAENRCALHQAVMYSNLILVECVIQFMTAELNLKELRGWTPIHYAAYQNDKALVELLLLRGGSQLACELDAGGQTPLSSAVAQCTASGEAIVPEVQQLLQAAEEKVRARNAR